MTIRRSILSKVTFAHVQEPGMRFCAGEAWEGDFELTIYIRKEVILNMDTMLRETEILTSIFPWKYEPLTSKLSGAIHSEGTI